MSSSQPTPSGPTAAQYVVEHYQKTYELTYEFWKERNNLFLWLVVFLAAVTLFVSLGRPNANSLLVVWVSKTIGLTNQADIDTLKNSINFDLLQTLALAVVFYLTVNLYHRTQNVIRFYKYLGELETEIRSTLNLPTNSIAFTRESSYYWNKRSRLLGLIKYVYIFILLVLLGGFVILRLYEDWLTGWNLFRVANVIIALAIALYFGGYVWVSKDS